MRPVAPDHGYCPKCGHRLHGLTLAGRGHCEQHGWQWADWQPPGEPCRCGALPGQPCRRPVGMACARDQADAAARLIAMQQGSVPRDIAD